MEGAAARCSAVRRTLRLESARPSDSRNGRQILDLLFELADEAGRTLVMVTHDQDIARLGDRVLTIRDGVVQ